MPERLPPHSGEKTVLRGQAGKPGLLAGKWHRLKLAYGQLAASHENLRRDNRALAEENEALRAELAAEQAATGAVVEITWQAAQENARARLGFPARPERETPRRRGHLRSADRLSAVVVCVVVALVALGAARPHPVPRPVLHRPAHARRAVIAPGPLRSPGHISTALL